MEEQKNELAEQLKNANTRVDQYRAVVLTLEGSLQKEKEVLLLSIVCFQYSHSLSRHELTPVLPLCSLAPLWSCG